ncbi:MULTISPECIES: branched-chain amino acid ABC transporter permease [Burkholderiaceae]|jgi:branched-chain amino acid transport system permease protein|uniref:branched-chain amino acid ABC transporter permease n=1 Tax=Burkholderiaceae TaxID=119060 RepID=UPI000488AE7C|nr:MULTISPECIES: branched-chain amino acid ABC transporter permease [Burkholderiaceae]KHS13877.1 ABC transporter permease [Burkholderia multivorans]MDR9227693.1 High-affinity branched-chain amino acid transport system permease protein LivH [Burkholderia multivorans]PRF10169.1 branched-chain amino acid ABC transporter permease [Burkholderia multivorans]USX10788.1 branched-chain amino acid ABC transporter permease [Paraburkholderia fungorum]HDR9471914.1 branched-chain amino acid ABC transporter 
MEFFVSQLINSLAFAFLLFLMSAGLSLIFGLMNVVNLAHGSFFMLGAFTAFMVERTTGNFWLALSVAWLPAVVLAVLLERFFLRPMYGRGHLDQMLLTFGFVFVFGDLAKFVWGPEIRSVAPPELLRHAVHLGGTSVPSYRLFIVVVGFVIAIALWLFLERSRIGAMIRASVDDAETASGIGINVRLLFGGAFALGAALAAFGGIIASPVMGAYLGLDIEILVPAFIVVVIGGMGNLKGALIASIFVALVQTFGNAYFPQFSLFSIYLLMIVVLIVRPRGLFGALKG